MGKKRELKDLSASVKSRLLTLSQVRGEDMNVVLKQFAIERLLYRISRSEHRDRFVLKGAMLFVVWEKIPHRPTRDVDFLGLGTNDVNELERVFQEVGSVLVEEDGLFFDPVSVKGSVIKKDDAYKGVRIKLVAFLGNARIPVQADIGYGDYVVPSPELVIYPTLLEFPEPRLKAYTYHTVIAEKFHAIVELGLASTRMKDFYDLWYLGMNFDMGSCFIGEAIKETFDKRGTEIPQDISLSFMNEFYTDEMKLKQWEAFLRRNGLVDEALGFQEVIEVIQGVLSPHVELIGRNEY